MMTGLASALPGLVDLLLKSLALLVLASASVVVVRQASASVRHLVRALGFVGILCLPLIEALAPPLNVPILPATAVMPAGSSQVAGLGSPANTALVERYPSHAPARPAHAAVRDSEHAISLAAVAVSIWLAGVLVAGCPWIVAVFRVRRNASRCVAAPPPILLEAEAAAAALGVRCVPEVLIARSQDVVASPLVSGSIAPRVLLPEAAFSWTAPRIRAVLLHELAHVVRRDWLWNILAELVCALYWPNPLVRLAARELRLEAEKASDDMAVNGGMRPAEYAHELVELLRGCRPGGGCARASATIAEPASIEARVTSLLDGHRRRGRTAARSAVCAALTALAATCCIAVVRVSAQSARVAEPIPAVSRARPAKATMALERARRAEQAEMHRRLTELRRVRQEALRRVTETDVLTAELTAAIRARAASDLVTRQGRTSAHPLAVVRPQAPTPPILTEVVRLKHTRPSSITEGLMGEARRLPEGIAAVGPDDATSSFLLAGTPAGIAGAKQQIQRLDVPKTSIRLNMRVFHTDAGNPAKTRVTNAPMVMTMDGMPVNVAIKDGARSTRVEVLPQVNADGSVTCRATLRLLRGPEALTYALSSTNTRRIATGQAAICCWVPDPDKHDPSAKQPAAAAMVPNSPQDRPGYYLEVTPIIEDLNGKPPR